MAQRVNELEEAVTRMFTGEAPAPKAKKRRKAKRKAAPAKKAKKAAKKIAKKAKKAAKKGARKAKRKARALIPSGMTGARSVEGRALLLGLVFVVP